MSTQAVRVARGSDRAELVRMRTSLWPDSDGSEVERLLASPGSDAVVFVAQRDGVGLQGFAEVATRKFADGCRTSPVGYLEGIWVDADARRSGIASDLVREASEWVRAHGLRELASDCEIQNGESHAFHLAAGFEEVQRNITFRLDLSESPGRAPGGSAVSEPHAAPSTPGSPKVRAAVLEDVPRLASLNAALGRSEGESEMGVGLERLMGREQEVVLVAESEAGLVQGWIHGGEREVLGVGRRCEITGLVVDPDLRGFGIGRSLVAAVEAWASARGLERVLVRSNVLRSASHPFYERLGYSRAKTQHVYRKTGKPED